MTNIELTRDTNLDSGKHYYEVIDYINAALGVLNIKAEAFGKWTDDMLVERRMYKNARRQLDERYFGFY